MGCGAICSNKQKANQGKTKGGVDAPITATASGGDAKDNPSSSAASLKLEKGESRVQTPFDEHKQEPPPIPIYDITPNVTRSYKIYQVTGK